MKLEIERKFLVVGEAWRRSVAKQVRMRQGYLAAGKRASVRIRVAGDAAWLNIKSGGFAAVRREFEYPVPLQDGRTLLESLCEREPLEKTRHWLEHRGFEWEIDEFHGANEGLVVAEIELDDEARAFPRPPWLGSEVTELPRYYNASLATHPFRDWSAKERDA
jgi:adenylate cyclase